MGLRFVPRKRERKPRKLKLWHLAVSVVVASVVLGGVKALARPSDASITSAALGFLAVWILSCSALIFVSVGARLGNRVSERIQSWGLQHGGAGGFVVWLIALALNLAITLGTTAVGIAVILGLFFALFRYAA